MSATPPQALDASIRLQELMHFSPILVAITTAHSVTAHCPQTRLAAATPPLVLKRFSPTSTAGTIQRKVLRRLSSTRVAGLTQRPALQRSKPMLTATSIQPAVVGPSR